MAVARLGLTTSELSLDALTSAALGASSEPVGAIASFVGVVRGRNLGRTVTFLEYEAYEALALKVFARIEQEAREAWPSATLAFHHRIGRLDVGEASIAIVAVSAHRADAFAA